MAERKIAVGRKSQMFLHSIIPVVNTHDELVKQKLKAGKYPVTITGIIKIIGMAFLLASIGIFLSNSPCSQAYSWFPYLLPGVLGVHIIVVILLYITFSFGLTVNNPGTWVKIDILSNLSLSAATIVSSVLSIAPCSTISGTSLQRIPMILGMCGGGILIISCASLFLLYRYREDDDEESVRRNAARIDPRKSVFA